MRPTANPTNTSVEDDAPIDEESTGDGETMKSRKNDEKTNQEDQPKINETEQTEVIQELQNPTNGGETKQEDAEEDEVETTSGQSMQQPARLLPLVHPLAQPPSLVRTNPQRQQLQPRAYAAAPGVDLERITTAHYQNMGNFDPGTEAVNEEPATTNTAAGVPTPELVGLAVAILVEEIPWIKTKSDLLLIL